MEHEPDAIRLREARESVQSFLIRKQRWTTALFIAAGVFEVVLFMLMLLFADFSDRLQLFLLFGFLATYCPLITFAWRNSIKIDQLYYRLVNELKYGD